MPRLRQVLVLIAAFFALGSPAAQSTDADQAALIYRAYEYAFPIFEHARLRYNFSFEARNPQRVPVNQFSHRRTLADYTDHTATTPNNDTLYSSAIVDLSGGPVRLDVPAFGSRYYSIAFLDSFTNDFAYVGTRTTGGGAGSYLIVRPDWRGTPPPGVRLIRATTNDVIALARIFISGPDDYDAVHRLQDALIFTPAGPSRDRPDLIRPVPGDPENFVAVVDQVLHDNPPPAADEPILKELKTVGVGPDLGPLTDAQRQAWQQYFPQARMMLLTVARQGGILKDGWQYAPPDIGNFGTDYRIRAILALRGIWATGPEEVTYSLAMTDAAGARLDGERRYRLHLPPGEPAVDGFWSLSMYEVEPSGGLFFGDNPIHRYAVNSLTSPLSRNADGSLDLLIQKASPGAGQEANWLPVPSKNFALIFRAYLPKPEVVDGRFRYPGLVPLD
jgi:hypothetical protein